MVVFGAIWAVSLLTVEYIALVIGIVGAITGSVALWKALHALRILSTMEESQHERLVNIEETAIHAEETLTQDLETLTSDDT